jgi:hypothetical protein
MSLETVASADREGIADCKLDACALLKDKGSIFVV